MKPEDLSPTQLLQVAALGMIIITLLIGSFASWGVLLFRLTKGMRFQSSVKPTASVGFVDCVIAVAILFVFMVAGATSWRFFNGPVAPSSEEIASVSTDSVIENDQPVEEESDPLPDSPTEQESTAETESTAEPIPEEKSKEKKLSKEDVLGSGWITVAQLFAGIVTLIIVVNRLGGDWRAVGISSSGLLRDIGIGGWVLLLMLPPIVTVNVITTLVSGVEYNHPIIDALKNYPWLVGVIAFQAVIVAPLTEEFFFRSLLIGWFESAHFGRTAKAVLFGWKPSSVATDEANTSEDWKPASFEAPYTADSSQIPSEYRPPWWPAIVSGVLFGLAHFSYGVSWIPLIVFGIIMGRVYQLRQSLIMCVAVHMLFNGINIINLWLSLGLPINKN
ncbi:CPBP family intramembrane glutamic endopeptidase [Pirellulaceae bacterium SH449]